MARAWVWSHAGTRNVSEGFQKLVFVSATNVARLAKRVDWEYMITSLNHVIATMCARFAEAYNTSLQTIFFAVLVVWIAIGCLNQDWSVSSSCRNTSQLVVIYSAHDAQNRSQRGVTPGRFFAHSVSLQITNSECMPIFFYLTYGKHSTACGLVRKQV